MHPQASSQARSASCAHPGFLSRGPEPQFLSELLPNGHCHEPAALKSRNVCAAPGFVLPSRSTQDLSELRILTPLSTGKVVERTRLPRLRIRLGFWGSYSSVPDLWNLSTLLGCFRGLDVLFLFPKVCIIFYFSMPETCPLVFKKHKQFVALGPCSQTV